MEAAETCPGCERSSCPEEEQGQEKKTLGTRRAVPEGAVVGREQGEDVSS